MSSKKKKKDQEADMPSESAAADEEEALQEVAPVADAQASDAASAAPGAEAAPGPGTGELAARLAGLETQLAESTERLLRKAADFDNFRKRMARDKEDGIRFANTGLIEDLVPVIDALERAIASSETSRDYDVLHNGVVLIEKQLMDALARKWGLERMKAVGAAFDPMLHQALTVGEPAEGPERVVLEEYESGYTLHGRVLRPAKVRVSAPPKVDPTSGQSGVEPAATQAPENGSGGQPGPDSGA